MASGQMPSCAICNKLVTCFRWASEEHRRHKSCVLCSGCAGYVDDLALLFAILDANEAMGIDSVVTFRAADKSA